jgi:hypothetical protein
VLPHRRIPGYSPPAPVESSRANASAALDAFANAALPRISASGLVPLPFEKWAFPRIGSDQITFFIDPAGSDACAGA